MVKRAFDRKGRKDRKEERPVPVFLSRALRLKAFGFLPPAQEA
jgi:hypothetical protein